MKLQLINKDKSSLNQADLNKALSYINSHWKNLIISTPQDKGTLIGLPNPYIIPSTNSQASFNFEEQYYWDTYFIILGLKQPEHATLVKGMIENLVYIYKRFGLIPNASRMYFTSRSQPPLLTSMINYYNDTFGADQKWYDDMMSVALDEYKTVWMSEKHPHWRKVGQLNRYYDINSLHDLAEAESGWDMTPRFSRKCLDFYPVDLNSLLYKYEQDFAEYYAKKNDLKNSEFWLYQAKIRAEQVDSLLWGRNRKFYFDYNFEEQRRGLTYSLAGFYPMWAKMISEQKARELVKNLSKFERDGGLTTTTRSLVDISIFGSVKTQWAYPNGWAPLQWIVIEGLNNYGYYEDAKRIATKWLKNNTDWYTQHSEFLEKYNVVNPNKEPKEGVYPSQTGFGWTNGVFVDLANKYAR
jgi:alpha,alpha-trehalase